MSQEEQWREFQGSIREAHFNSYFGRTEVIGFFNTSKCANSSHIRYIKQGLLGSCSWVNSLVPGIVVREVSMGGDEKNSAKVCLLTVRREEAKVGGSKIFRLYREEPLGEG